MKKEKIKVPLPFSVKCRLDDLYGHDPDLRQEREEILRKRVEDEIFGPLRWLTEAVGPVTIGEGDEGEE
jgi:hypothetical protein